MINLIYKTIRMEDFILYIKSLEDRILNIERYIKEKDKILDDFINKEPIGKMKLSYYPNWRNDINIDGFNHITHCFINEPKDFDKVKIIPNVKNGISIGGWNGRNKIIDLMARGTHYMDAMIDKANLLVGLDYINLDVEYPPNNDWAIRMCKYFREHLAENIKLCVAVGLWSGFSLHYKNCSQYLDWIEIMAYDNDIFPFIEKSLKTLNEVGFPNNKILIGYSNDKNGDNQKSKNYKQGIINNYLGIMLWNNPVGDTFNIDFNEIVEPLEEYVWKSKWKGNSRKLKRAREVDPFDNMTTFRGNGFCEMSKGIMKLSGSQPRLYINLDLQDVKVSIDYKRIGTDGQNWSGGSIGVRSDIEGHSKRPEYAHTYYFRLKHEGRVDFYREITHGTGGGTGDRKILKIIDYKWDSNKWYNMKFQCYNDWGEIILKGYINNELVLEYIDDNAVMNNASGVVIIRNTSIEEALYRNMIIKKI